MPSTKTNTSAIIGKDNPELAQAAEIFDAWGLVGIFIIVFFEICTPLGVLFPTDAIIFVAGLLYGASGFPGGVIALIIVLLIPVVLGNLFGYRYGQKLGNKLNTMNDTWYFKKEYLTMGRHYFEDYGNKAFYIGTFLPIRSIIPPIAGILQWPWIQFLLHSTIAGLMWLIPLVTISYAITAYIPVARDYIPTITLLVVVVPQLIVAWKLVWPTIQRYQGRITAASDQISTIVEEIKTVGANIANVTSAVIHDKPIELITPKAPELPIFTAILVDALGCLIATPNVVDIDTYRLQKEFADFITNLRLPVIVVCNDEGERLNKIVELLSPYTTPTPNTNTSTIQTTNTANSQTTSNRTICSYANNPAKDNAQYFANVIAYYHLDPASVLYIDHAQINLNAAKSNAIRHTVLYTDPKTAQQVINKMINPLTPVTISTPTPIDTEEPKAEIVMQTSGQSIDFYIPKESSSGASLSLFNPNSATHAILSDFTFVIGGLGCAIHTDVSHTKEACVMNEALANFCTSMKSQVILVTDEKDDMYNLILSMIAPYSWTTFTLHGNPPKTKTSFWEQFLFVHKLNPLKIILVDDNIETLTAAQGVGIGRSILYTDYEPFVEQVQTLMKFEKEKMT